MNKIERSCYYELGFYLKNSTVTDTQITCNLGYDYIIDPLFFDQTYYVQVGVGIYDNDLKGTFGSSEINPEVTYLLTA